MGQPVDSSEEGTGHKCVASVLCYVCWGDDDKVSRHVPELMAYMISILQASQEYESLAWATYDAAYHRQATGYKQWSKVNSSLYTIRAKQESRPDATYVSAKLTRHQSALWQ